MPQDTSQADALLTLIAEQQTTILAIREEIKRANETAERYRTWWLEEQDKVSALTSKTTDNA